MPTSYFKAISTIMDQVIAFMPNSVLDLGVGFGKYGMLSRELMDVPFERYDKKDWKGRLDGVEGWEAYRNPIHDYVYDHVYYGKIEDVLPGLGTYDVVLFIDVLEHFTKEDGLRLLREILKHTDRALIVSTPILPSAQGDYLGNDLETHRSRWVPEDFQEFRHQYQTVPVGDAGAQIYTIIPEVKPPDSQVELAMLGLVDEIWTAPAPRREGPLRISYVLPTNAVTGGMKVLMEQIRHLRQRGHQVTVLCREWPGKPILPPWTDVRADEEIRVGLMEPYADKMPETDVVVAGWFRQLPELAFRKFPVLYLEQGHQHLFGDTSDLDLGLYSELVFQRSMYLPVALAGVSPIVQQILAEKFGRRSGLLPNAIDTQAFHPGIRPNRNRVLLVGNPKFEFKGFKVALKALQKVALRMPELEVTWVCQSRPAITGVNLPIRFIVDPPQCELPSIYRESDLLLFTSWYEGFGLPPLEAMASGIPVVMTNCLGNEAYARPGENCLLADAGDVDSLAWGVIQVLNNPDLAEALRLEGRRTAEAFTWDAAIDRLEDALYRTASLGRSGSERP